MTPGDMARKKRAYSRGLEGVSIELGSGGNAQLYSPVRDRVYIEADPTFKIIH